MGGGVRLGEGFGAGGTGLVEPGGADLAQLDAARRWLNFGVCTWSFEEYNRCTTVCGMGYDGERVTSAVVGCIP